MTTDERIKAARDRGIAWMFFLPAYYPLLEVLLNTPLEDFNMPVSREEYFKRMEEMRGNLSL